MTSYRSLSSNINNNYLEITSSESSANDLKENNKNTTTSTNLVYESLDALASLVIDDEDMQTPLRSNRNSHNLTVNEIQLLSIVYNALFGVCGISLVLQIISLYSISKLINIFIFELSLVFVTRALGCIFAYIISRKVLNTMKGHKIISFLLLMIAFIIYMIPATANKTIPIIEIDAIYLSYFLLGLSNVLLDSASQLMIRKLLVHKDEIYENEANVLSTTQTIFYSIGGTIALCIKLLPIRTSTWLRILSFLIFIFALMFSVLPNPEKDGRIIGSIQKNYIRPRHYYIEYILGLTIFCVVGTEFSLLSFLRVFLINFNVRYDQLLILCFWLCLSATRYFGSQENLSRYSETFEKVFLLLCLFASLLLISCIWLITYPFVIWILVSLIGLILGSLVGIIYDILMKLTYHTEKSNNILIYSLYAGSAIIPYTLCRLVFDNVIGVYHFLICLSVIMLIPIPFIYSIRSVSYDAAANPLAANDYTNLDQDEEEVIDYDLITL